MASDLQVTLSIPRDFDANHLMLLFKLRTAKREFFGPNFILFARFTDPLRSSLNQLCDEDRNCKSSFEEQDPVELKKPSKVERFSDEQLFGMASILMDEGYGSFDRCLLASRTWGGDVKRVREVLSSLMMAEAQLDR